VQNSVNLCEFVYFVCAEMGKGATTGDVWFRFKEGYLNAVRKTVRIQDLMSWTQWRDFAVVQIVCHRHCSLAVIAVHRVLNYICTLCSEKKTPTHLFFHISKSGV